MAEKIATDLAAVICYCFAVAAVVVAACEIALPSVGYFPAVSSASKVVVVTAAVAGKETANSETVAVVAGEHPVVVFPATSENWHKYWKAPLDHPSSFLKSSAGPQRCFGCSACWNFGHQHLACYFVINC